MRAITYSQHGDADVLEVADVPVPEPQGKDVRVRVHAAGVNAFDWKVRSGAFEGLPSKFPSTPGFEIAGVVDAVGPDAQLSLGDEVFGWPTTGGYAEYALGWKLARKPAGLSWEDAVALPVAAEAAARALGLLNLQPGETLLVHGGTGNVGGLALQIAVARGITVVATAGPGEESFVGDRGGIGVAYGAGLADRVREAVPAVDAALDAAGHGALDVSLDLGIAPERIVSLVDPRTAEVGGTFTTSSTGDPIPLLEEVAGLVAAGKVKLGAARTYALSAAADAQRASEQGAGGGKIVLIP